MHNSPFLPAAWTYTPGTVHACLQGDAEFPWDYDVVVNERVSSLEWQYIRTGHTVLAAEKYGDTWIVREHYHPDVYGARVYRMDPRAAGAGLLLKNVTLYDEGEYRVLVGGYSNVRDYADLKIQTRTHRSCYV